MTKYWAHPATGISEDEVQVYGKELDRLAKQYGDGLPTEIVLDEARSKKSPLHPFFEWDDSDAAEKYRKYQARKLVNSIRVVHHKDDEPIRAFVNIHAVSDDNDEQGQSAYMSTEKALGDPRYRGQILARLYARLSSLNRELRQYEEFANVSREIEQIESTVREFA